MLPSPTQLWLDDFFRDYHARRPVNATFVGVHQHDQRLPDVSESGLGDLAAGMQGLLSRVPRLQGERGAASGGETPVATDPAVDPAVEALDLRLASGFLRISLWECGAPQGPTGNPTFYTGEAAFGVLSLFLSDFAPLSERVESAVRRLEDVPRFLEEGRRNLLSGPGSPREWTLRALRECRGALAFLDRGVEALARDIARAGDPASVLPAFRRSAATAARAVGAFADWLEAHHLPRHRDEVSCGPEILDLHIREGHLLPYRASEIADHARHEMAEARTWLEAHARDFGADTPEAALARLTDARPSAEGYLDRYREIWDACRRVAEQEEVVTWPDFPIRYVERPAWARDAAPWLYFLFYRSPAAHGRPPVHDYLVAPLPEAEADQPAFLRTNNDSVIRANHVVHHGGLGHHVQNWHAFRSPSRVGRMAAVDCASRIAMHCGGTMAEGWACYATDLMAELAERGVEGGFTPLEAYAERAARVRMCARALVDVELHSGRMTLDEAADAYVRHAGMPRPSAEAEAVKNSLFPGMALMYLMGTDEIHRLRRDASAALGSRFRLRDLHDRFLSFGSIPVTAAADLVRRDWVDQGAR